MGAAEEKSRRVKDSAGQNRALNIMIVGKVGKVRSFKISPRLLLWALIFLFLYIPVSIWVVNRYIDIRRKTVAQEETIKRLQSAVSKTKNEHYRIKQHVTLLENYISNLEEQEKYGGREGVETEQQQETDAGADEKPTEKETPEESSPEVADVKDIVIRKGESRLTVNFKLLNVKRDDGPVSGYLHTIVLDDKTDPVRAWAYPKQELKDGMPRNYRRGLIFLIHRYKPIQAKFNLIPGSDPPTAVRILIYNQDGVLILEKEFEVKDET